MSNIGSRKELRFGCWLLLEDATTIGWLILKIIIMKLEVLGRLQRCHISLKINF
jgi:hypothetical protein